VLSYSQSDLGSPDRIISNNQKFHKKERKEGRKVKEGKKKKRKEKGRKIPRTPVSL
jgi:hypothetical protein